MGLEGEGVDELDCGLVVINYGALMETYVGVHVLRKRMNIWREFHRCWQA